MNAPAASRFARCAREDFRRLRYHVRGFFRSIFQPSRCVVQLSQAKDDKPRRDGCNFNK